jgi:hypothetical protein
MKGARLIPMFLFAAWQAIGAEPKSPPPASAQSVQVRGRVVCLAEEMHRAHGALLPTNHEHLWGFQARDGTCYTLLRSKFSEAIFLDEQLRKKELVLEARLFPKSQILEVTALRSFGDGKVQDLYYYCTVCSIKAVSPEPCACCQGPMELREGPLSEHDN